MIDIQKMLADYMCEQLAKAGRDVPNFENGSFGDANLDKALKQMITGVTVYKAALIKELSK